MKYYLIVASGERRGFPIPIEVDLFMMGQNPSCQLRSKSPRVGEQHCAIARRERKLFIRDLGSGQATLVNGEPMPPSEEWPLHSGDLIGVGPLSFRLSFSEKSMTKKDLEEWALKTLDQDTGKKASALDELAAAMAAGAIEHKQASDAAEAMINRMSAMKGVVRGRLRITVEGVGFDAVTVVRVNETYLVEDAEIALLRKELRENLDRPNLRVLIDLKSVRRMSTAAARMCAELGGWLRGKGGVLAFCRLRPEIEDAIMGLSFDQPFRIFPDKPQALGSRW